MKDLKIIIVTAVALIILFGFKQTEKTLINTKSRIIIFSHTDVEDISAVNYASTSILNKETGQVVVSIPMQSFEFKKALMQKHFNGEKYLHTKAFPKAKFKGKITNLKEINFLKDGVYNAFVMGEITIKGTAKTVKEKGTITINSGQVRIDTKLKIVLVDYKIALERGKAERNVAESIEVACRIEY